MTVWLCCDRCRRLEPIAVNSLPPGWVRTPLGWPGREEDVCSHCLTVPELEALAGRLEVER